MINAVGRDIPEEILKATGKEVFQGVHHFDGHVYKKHGPEVECVINSNGSKMVDSIHDVLVKCGIKDGMTVSFHHHFREGDYVVNMVMKEIHELYVMHYTQWNRKQARLAVATSRDLQTWEKHGPAFAKAYNGRFIDEFSKSASIVTQLIDGKQVIAKIDGKYWMYWGEKFVNVATSTDLVNWEPMLDENGEFLKVMTPRAGKFDSDLTECGPPAILTDKGILLFYNGKNKSGAEGDTLYTANSYCAGQALFDAKDPTKLIDRLDKPFYIPESDFEKSGQYPAGTVFIEGLVFYNQKWFLYYGCADSRVAVAVYDPLKK